MISWSDGEHYSCPMQSIVVSLFLSLVSTLLFSGTGSALSHRSFLAQRFLRFPPRNLCSCVMLAIFPLVFAATDTAYCYALMSVGLAESKILPAPPANTRPGTPLISFCTVQLRTFCTARSLTIFCLYTTSGPGPGELPSFWGPWSSAMPPSLGRGRVTKTAKLKLQTHHYVTKGVSKFRRS